MAVWFAGFLWLANKTIATVAGRLGPVAFMAFAALFLFVPFGLETASMLLGEVPGVSFLLAAGILLGRGAALDSARFAFAAGILLGLAILTKLVLAVCAAGFFPALVLCAELRGRWRSVARLACWCAAGMLLPLLVWQLVIFAHLGWAQYWANVLDLQRWMQFAGSGLGSPSPGSWAHVEALARVLQISPHLLAATLASVTAVLLWVVRTRPLPFPACSLVLATLAAWIWWIRFSSWMAYRHLMPAYLVLSILLPLAASAALTDSRKRRVSRLAAGIVFALSTELFVPRVVRPMLRHDPILADQLAAAAFIEERHRHNPETRFWAVGWSQAPQLSFLARVAFGDLSRASPQQGENYLVIYPAGGAEKISGIREYVSRYCDGWLFRRHVIGICHLKANPPRATPDTVVRRGLMPR
jgi:hypothetical protein